MNRPVVEYANASADRLAAYDWLAGSTGLPVATIRGLVAQHKIADLYDIHGRILPCEELRGKFGGPPPISGREAQDMLRSKRIGPGPIDPRRAVVGLLAKRYPPGPLTPASAHIELAQKRAPRQRGSQWKFKGL